MTTETSLTLSGGVLHLSWAQLATSPGVPPTVLSSPQHVYVEDSIADTDPEADRSSVFNAVLGAVGASGGGSVRWRGNHRILADVHIPQNVALVGPVWAAGQLNHLGAGAADYERKPGVLRVAPAATIRVGPSGMLANGVLVRDGLNLPFTSASEALSGIAAFSGTAVTMQGNDARVSNLLVLGFALAVDSNNYARGRFTDIQGDCLNGIRVAACTDVPYFEKCHFWPFTTANYTWTASDPTQRILVRPGVGFELKNTVDWAKMVHCFTYGYFRGFRLGDVHAATLTGCAADNPVVNGTPVVAGAIGALVEGHALDNQLVSFTAAGASQGIFLGCNSGTFTTLMGCNTVACDIGINVRDGDAQIIGGLDRVVRVGLQVQSPTSRVTVMRKMRQVSMVPLNASAPSNIQVIGTLT